jgi:quinol monooxygenase YgiN
MDRSTAVVNVNQYELRDGRAPFEAAIEALAERTRREGHPGVQTYWWYVDDDDAAAGAVIVYADAAAWLAHHHMAYQWPEMAALQATVALTGLTVFGPLDAEVEQWISNAGLVFAHYPDPVAGFRRT